MKIISLKIDHFRSIEKCNLQLSDATAIVGENNSGKSALLRALNTFFNPKSEIEDFKNGNHLYSSRTLARIELCFSDLPSGIPSKMIDNGNMTVRLTYRPAKGELNYDYKKGSYKPAEESIVDLISKHVRFVYIPPYRDKNHFKWEETTLLNEVVKQYLKNYTRRRDTYTSKFKTIANSLNTKVLNKIGAKVQKYYALDHGLDFLIEYPDSVTYQDFLTSIKFNIREHGKAFDICECGTGTQSLSIISLHRLLAHFLEVKIILGLEEPETNLHPQAQNELMHSLINSNEESQLFITTHSTVIVDKLGHENIVLARKVLDQKRGFKTRLSSLSKNFWQKYELEEFKYYQFHRYRNSDFFFSRLVIIVESKNDAEVVRELMKQKNVNMDEFPVSVINLEGVRNLKYPLSVLRELNIPFFVILDKDYFLEYSSGNLGDSRDGSGYPKFSHNSYKSGSLVDKLIANRTDRNDLLQLLKENHSRALDVLAKYNIICMKYSLEVDLVASKTAASLYYDLLNIPPDRRNSAELLINNYKGIKKIAKLMHVVKNTPHRNLPNSYKRIKAVLAKKILMTRER